jgi:hypothetical protein
MVNIKNDSDNIDRVYEGVVMIGVIMMTDEEKKEEKKKLNKIK